MKDFSLSYDFNSEELKALFLLFRKNRSCVSGGLFNFLQAVQNTLYGSMSVDEVEEFLKK